MLISSLSITFLWLFLNKSVVWVIQYSTSEWLRKMCTSHLFLWHFTHQFHSYSFGLYDWYCDNHLIVKLPQGIWINKSQDLLHIILQINQIKTMWMLYVLYSMVVEIDSQVSDLEKLLALISIIIIQTGQFYTQYIRKIYAWQGHYLSK